DRADVVIEAVVEDLQVKRGLLREAGERFPHAILASNTSSLTIASLAEGMPGPGRIAGMHFFNPVHKMPLVEVVRHAGTSPETMAKLMKLASSLGKVPVAVGDGPGFVVNRILGPYLAEAVRLVGEGLAISSVDGLMRRFGMPMGPLEVLDQVGLDVAARVAPHDKVFAAMAAKGWLGAKSGKGFYVHSGKKAAAHAEAQALVRELGDGPGMMAKLPTAARLAEARERLVLSMVAEARRVEKAGLADAERIDLAMVFGAGWAPHRGGPLAYAKARGEAEVREALGRLAARLGERFRAG
ncbi:MAG: hypothetical protein K2W96_19645, partial [Gemmataceae bacterium]|nr:hypothetical protein [Gemmataceae bacterium]